MPKRLYAGALALLCLFAPLAQGQQRPLPTGDYISPLDGEVCLSGSFGEIRSHHYHTGTDMRTGGVEGWVARAVMDGYISRINVALGSYGLCIYITHPNGTTSVYGHLSGFAPEVQAWVEQQQYKRHTYTLTLFPSKGQFPVKQGELIGWTGNTGSSGGPHLHFELRHGNNIPYCSYLGGVRYDDRIPPAFKRLYLYALDTTNYDASLRARRPLRLIRRKGVYTLKDTLRLPRVAGLGVFVTDLVNKNSLRCNIHALDMRVDSLAVYHFDIDEAPFPQTAYADAHIDYPLRIERTTRAQLLYTLPGNTFNRYETKGHGIIHSLPGQVHTVEIQAADAAGNRSTLRFVTKGNGEAPAYPHEPDAQTIGWQEGGKATGEGYSVLFPPRALYYDLPFFARFGDSTRTSPYGPPLLLFRDGTALHKPVTLTLSRFALPDSLQPKAYFAYRDRGKWKFHSVAKWHKGLPSTSLRDFSTFTILVDTVPPTIRTPKREPICHAKLSGPHTITLRVQDSQTGIRGIQGQIDGEWTLWEYDPKRGEIYHHLSPLHTTPNQQHHLRVRVDDQVGNATVLECPFFW